MRYLEQNATVTLQMGPFLDEEDGITPEDLLTIEQADVRISKNGGAFGPKNEITDSDHDEAGWYQVNLDDTDTNTAGALMVAIHMAGALPVWREFIVLPSVIYDSLVLGSQPLPVDATYVNSVDASEMLDDIDAILTDTNELQTDDVPGLIAALNDLSAGDVNAEMVDALATDTYGQPAQAAPPSPATIAQMFRYLYFSTINKGVQTEDEKQFYDQTGTTMLWKKQTDDDGLGTYTEETAEAGT